MAEPGTSHVVTSGDRKDFVLAVARLREIVQNVNGLGDARGLLRCLIEKCFFVCAILLASLKSAFVFIF